MNTYIRRWKEQHDAVQKVIDAIPESNDHTAEIQADDKRSRTDTDNLSQFEEEKKDEKVPRPDQESKNIDDHAMIPDRKVTEGSKAGAAKPLPES